MNDRVGGVVLRLALLGFGFVSWTAGFAIYLIVLWASLQDSHADSDCKQWLERSYGSDSEEFLTLWKATAGFHCAIWGISSLGLCFAGAEYLESIYNARANTYETLPIQDQSNHGPETYGGSLPTVGAGVGSQPNALEPTVIEDFTFEAEELLIPEEVSAFRYSNSMTCDSHVADLFKSLDIDENGLISCAEVTVECAICCSLWIGIALTSVLRR